MPVTLTRWMVRFAPLLSKRVWEHAQMLVVGALLAPGKRTVTAGLRALGLEHAPHFQTYHRVLNRVRWSSLAVARVLLGLVVETFVATGPVVIGIDETVERRRGAKIKAKGIDRDPVRSSRAFGQGKGVAMAVCYGVGGDSPGRPGVGLTLSHSVMSL